jgi:hypothetical protein
LEVIHKVHGTLPLTWEEPLISLVCKGTRLSLPSDIALKVGFLREEWSSDQLAIERTEQRAAIVSIEKRRAAKALIRACTKLPLCLDAILKRSSSLTIRETSQSERRDSGTSLFYMLL